MAEGEVPGDYIKERTDLHDTIFLVGSEKKEKISTIKYFLVNYSLYFRKMLLETDMREKFTKDSIKIKDHEPDVFKLMLSYVYGEHHLQFVDVDQAMRFHVLVNYCLMPKLMSVSSKYLMDNCKKNLCDVLKCAVILNIKEMEPRAEKMLQTEVESFLASEHFEDLEKAIVEFIVQQEHIDIKEICLWRALLKWANKRLNEVELKTPKCGDFYEGSILRDELGNILTYVRFLGMSQEEFAQYVVPTYILTKDEVVGIFVAMATGKPHGLGVLSEEKVRTKLIFDVELKVNGQLHHMDSSCHLEIKVKDRNLRLKSFELHHSILNLNFHVNVKNTGESVVSQLISGNSSVTIAVDDNILKANLTYHLEVSNPSYDDYQVLGYYDSFMLPVYKCVPKVSCDYCNILVRSSVIKSLKFVLI
uniref:BTB domain-containing protein n=1 Tax=Graphocephala atropunctata TaxID=36148 RepID=A0A1B6M0E7_9HEMI